MGENESRFRFVNERLRDLVVDEAERHGEHAQNVSVLCECADIDCTDKLELTFADYEWVRSAPARFVVAPGHVLVDSERAVREGGGYVIVEKFGDARAAASELDPRTN